ncbi:MAG: DEAD/DEAH box helicase [Candidatus Berkelbacteria bacterium]
MEKIVIKVGINHTLSELLNNLDNFGYERVSTVDVRSGEYAKIADRIVLWPVNIKSLVWIDYFGDVVENIFIIDSEKKIPVPEIEINKNYLSLTDGSQLRPGDYVVHEDCGIGLFHSLEVKIVEGEEIRYINIIYLNDDRLSVPITLADRLSLYIGVGKRKPKLSKLGSVTWKKNYHKIYENILLVAKELLNIYAKREIVEKKPYKIDEKWNEEVRKTFQYTETPDQEKAIAEVLGDLSNKKLMDRLICGDVGYGKTEIAIRAMIQAVANGYQVAILVPTTILAQQHFANLTNRCKEMPINIEHISRFVSSSDQEIIKKNIAVGSVDVIIGTHSILSAAVKFKNLGLLIIDEEQKFGVKQKEKIKIIKKDIDVLTLTATPIPRTLFMSLSGIKDISQVSNPPIGRQTIQTEVSLYDDEKIRTYLARELQRNGQAYYLHNRVSTIQSTKNKIQKMFPDAVVALGHGQMDEQKLSDTMYSFAQGKIDILVCSTIIENGLDLPNVNTIIIEDADRFGLSQMYQIRGRVGRSERKSYALFLHPRNITDNSIKRLSAIAENTDLGSGYNIALDDLEIRGGGNILGKEQHGNMEAIGLVLYSKLLKQMVEHLKKEQS